MGSRYIESHWLLAMGRYRATYRGGPLCADVSGGRHLLYGTLEPRFWSFLRPREVMEACQMSLFDRLIDNPRWAWKELAGDLHQLIAGLQHLHSRHAPCLKAIR